MEKLLLHHCCAPCSPSVVKTLKDEFDIESFWHNPNIHPLYEYEKRKKSIEDFTNRLNLKLHIDSQYDQDSWITEAPLKEEERCRYCYMLRLTQTALKANQLKIKYFCSTLLSSPYQKHQQIQSIGFELARQFNLTFVYKDFRPFYYEGKNEAYRNGSYMQKYCGCIFSFQKNKDGNILKV